MALLTVFDHQRPDLGCVALLERPELRLVGSNGRKRGQTGEQNSNRYDTLQHGFPLQPQTPRMRRQLRGRSYRVEWRSATDEREARGPPGRSLWTSPRIVGAPIRA